MGGGGASAYAAGAAAGVGAGDTRRRRERKGQGLLKVQIGAHDQEGDDRRRVPRPFERVRPALELARPLKARTQPRGDDRKPEADEPCLHLVDEACRSDHVDGELDLPAKPARRCGHVGIERCERAELFGDGVWRRADGA